MGSKTSSTKLSTMFTSANNRRIMRLYAAPEFTKPNGIWRNWKEPSLHVLSLSASALGICQYLFLKSDSEKNLLSHNFEHISLEFGIGSTSKMVTPFRRRKSITGPFFFLTRCKGDAYGDTEGSISFNSHLFDLCLYNLPYIVWKWVRF